MSVSRQILVILVYCLLASLLIPLSSGNLCNNIGTAKPAYFNEPLTSVQAKLGH